VATQIVELTGDEAKLLRSLDKIIQKEREHERQLSNVGNEGAAAGGDIEKALNRIGQANEKDIGRLLRDLGKVGPEGKVAAEELKKNFQEAGKFGQRSFDDIVESIRKIDPEAAKAAQEARAAMQKADQESEFKETLQSLRAMGPVGRNVAQELKKQLVDAGKISEQSIDDVIAKIRQIDPAAADAAAKLHKEMDSAARRGESSWARFSKNTVTQIGAVVGAYAGLQEGIQAVNQFLLDQQQLIDDALDKQLDLGKAQQDAAKNLAGLSVVERSELLQQSVPEIARSTGFSDVAEITQALGAVASAGESDPEQIANAVRQAARIERLTPENLDQTAAASSAVQRQAGLSDIRQAIALVETTGTQARITDPGQLLQSLPKAVGSAVSTVGGQDREEASRQAAALFAQITQFGNDEQGRSSATFTTDLAVRLEKFFTGLEDERIQARSRIEVLDRKISKGSATEADRQSRQQAADFLAASEGVTDSGTLFGRLRQIQSSQALGQRFVGEGFGEKQFQTALTGLLDSNSKISQALQSSFQTIQANPEFFEREASQLAAATPQLAISGANQGFEASVSAGQGFDNEGAALAQVRRIAAEAATQGNVGGVQGLVDSVTNDPFVGRGRLGGSTAVAEASSAIAFLNRKLTTLAQSGGGISPGERRKAENLRAAIRSIERTIVDVINSGGQLDLSEARSVAEDIQSGGLISTPQRLMRTNPDLAETTNATSQTLGRIADLLERQLAASEETAGNTRPEPTNYGEVQRGRQQ
jgi:hypothetical protein